MRPSASQRLVFVASCSAYRRDRNGHLLCRCRSWAASPTRSSRPPSICRRPTRPVRAIRTRRCRRWWWWRGFRSKELTDLMEESLTSRTSTWRRRRARRAGGCDLADRRRRAACRPSTSTAPPRARAPRTPPATETPSALARRRNRLSTYGISLSASCEIDFWGKNRAALRSAEELAVASRFDREVVALTTVATVAKTYFLVLAAKDRLDIARNNIEAADRVYKLIKQRFDVGTASGARRRPAGSPAGHPARLRAAAGAEPAAEHRNTGAADRPAAGSGCASASPA